MTYLEFITYLKSWLSGTTNLVYIKECLEDEIELPISESGIQRFPAAFITPLPFSIDDDNRATFSARIYLAGGVGLSPVLGTRFSQYSVLNDIFVKFVQMIPDEFNGIQFPITCNPVLLWDSNVDGIYYDISVISGVDCI